MPSSLSPLCSTAKLTSSSSVTLYRAPWVLPISSPVIRDGAVGVAYDRIVAVGNSDSLRKQFADARLEYCQGALLPGLVNAHVHLELSAFTDIPRPTPEQSFCDWIRSLLHYRQEGTITPAEIFNAAEQMLRLQHDTGVALLLDTGNSESSPLSSSLFSPVECLSLLEMLGPTALAEVQTLVRIASLPDSVAATAHAPYSTTAGIMTALKQRADRLGHIFSLHVAESVDEIELLRSGHGCFRGFLAERGAWEKTFPIQGMEAHGAVDYLERLGLLDMNLLSVHCVQVSEQEIRMLAARKCKVCLCPGSNRFLGVGVAPLESMLDHGLLPALGTDSLASNKVLDLWREMRILRADHPGVDPARVMAMATLGGALALRREGDFGALAAGGKATFLHVDGPAVQDAANADQLLDVLTACGRPPELHWIVAD